MKVINIRLLREFAHVFKCEACGKKTPGADPHHIFSKGAGRVDIKENLISLCRACHTGFHTSGVPSKTQLLVLAAEREGTTPAEIEAKVYRLRRNTLCKVWVVDDEGPVEPETCPKCERLETMCECLASCALCGAELGTCECDDSLPF